MLLLHIFPPFITNAIYFNVFKVVSVGGGQTRCEIEIVQSLSGEADEDVAAADGDRGPASGILLCRRPEAVVENVAGSSLVEVTDQADRDGVADAARRSWQERNPGPLLPHGGCQLSWYCRI